MHALHSLALFAALLASVPAHDGTTPLDAALWTAEGQPVQLKSFCGRPTVLIYEGRKATEVNRPLKDALWKRRAQVSDGAAQVLGVAALSELNWFPARSLAERAVRERQARVGIQMLIDWKGALASGAWKLQPETSSVLVLDQKGEVAFRASGALTEAQVEQVFGLLEQLRTRR